MSWKKLTQKLKVQRKVDARVGRSKKMTPKLKGQKKLAQKLDGQTKVDAKNERSKKNLHKS